MSKGLRSIRGVHDGLTADVQRWQHIEQTAREIFKSYAFSEVRLPVLEPTSLFVRSIGEATDIVSKEMYHFEDQGGDDICLRPEGTAGAVRAYLQAGLTRAGAQRWFYIGSMFRRERPQKGRLRQFQQIGVEWLNVHGPLEDAELLAMAHAFLSALAIPSLRLEINSLGCPVCRPDYHEKLVAYLQAHAGDLCTTCNERTTKNPMRVLDCKLESCQAQLADAPEIASHLCPDCASHFSGLKHHLDTLNVPYHINPRIVRGLDYYNRTAFEIVTDQLGAQGTVLAGGRYDGLVEELGGPPTPAVGFAIGSPEIIDRAQGLRGLSTRQRIRIADTIRTTIGSDAGGLAAALVTGLRDGISPQVAADMRNSGLAHLLAISGLHMGLLCGAVFFFIRFTN